MKGVVEAVGVFAKENPHDAALMGKKIAQTVGVTEQQGLAFSSGFLQTANLSQKWVKSHTISVVTSRAHYLIYQLFVYYSHSAKLLQVKINGLKCTSHKEPKTDMSLFDKARVEVLHRNITTVDKKMLTFVLIWLTKCFCWLKGQFQAQNNLSYWRVPSWLNRLSNITTNSDMQREGQT